MKYEHDRRSRRTNPRPSEEAADAGFTLVELLVVLSIIVLLGGIVAPQVLRYLGSARSDAAATQIQNIESALELFLIDNFRYPTTEEGLAVLSEPNAQLSERWNGPYLQNAAALTDPWGTPYVYRNEDGEVQIMSFGRDGSPGGTGEDRDLSNS
ncbi:general secretion pathway protein G [Palleronia marisminoris]|uniref:Type II secretion system core protein G n=1 Tax=Palleronia marisminoris TaxID=315423 RepID=A0A1Y5T9E1_9RHOB|nr:type II secretion system major pseudopilin GspG [Palleronia marisminoris]SFH20470.1 general secretion pathway protein G [Palleronia marisminoris]SLN56949.1 Type II secretion system protein G precursor [Palleronia marisminoris]